MKDILVDTQTAKQYLKETAEGKELIGDGTRTHSLPLVQGKHNDLKCISPNTVSCYMVIKKAQIKHVHSTVTCYGKQK